MSDFLREHSLDSSRNRNNILSVAELRDVWTVWIYFIYYIYYYLFFFHKSDRYFGKPLSRATEVIKYYKKRQKCTLLCRQFFSQVELRDSFIIWLNIRLSIVLKAGRREPTNIFIWKPLQLQHPVISLELWAQWDLREGDRGRRQSWQR